ncbi:uncharacterized protein FMAN_09409 [Fusarium mangiferae]|uniref:Uncharacterized protein n=1 Tax=Fusarium mangiferae TaxID=192010 RepID=A0A1L7T8Z8_FUSMA|nr:uncharacterized protein FMAN_09409 [Fusarium mangiferae]CVK91266.1 uncharacterized protein FMAN_09409 [Fusarium mangiferae]
MVEQAPTQLTIPVRPTTSTQTTTPTPGPISNFPVADPPTNWSNYSKEKKVQWLNVHGLKCDSTVNLGDCFRCGVKLYDTIVLVVRTILDIKAQVNANHPDSPLQEDLQVFIEALTEGVMELLYAVNQNVYSLVANGQFENEAQATTPVVIPEFPTLSDDNSRKPPESGKVFDTSFWWIFVDTLDLLIDKWPWLQVNRPGKEVTWAQLIQDTILTGQEFFTEYERLGSGSEPSDDEGSNI